jgi:hypothetical protein
MDSLRKKRNRIHIQNYKWDKPYDEGFVFDEKLKILSEKVLEKIFNTMVVKYPRREEYHGFVKDFDIPWNRHFEFKNPETTLSLEDAEELGII